MENNELLRKYELMIIVDARLTNEERESVWKEVMEIVNKGGGKVVNSRVWLERHKLAFSIKKCREGTYYLINMEGPGTLVEKIRSLLKNYEKVLRFSVIYVESFAAVAVKV